MAAFSMFDISRTGFMNRKDFREALKKLQVLPTNICTDVYANEHNNNARSSYPSCCNTNVSTAAVVC
jgi:Ca2+-binding EF-hand superfamily protein